MSDIGEMVFLPLLMERVHALAPRLQIEVVEVPMEALPQALRTAASTWPSATWPDWAVIPGMPCCSASTMSAWRGAATRCCRAA